MPYMSVEGLSFIADLCIVLVQILVQTNVACRVLDDGNLPNPIDSDKIT